MVIDRRQLEGVVKKEGKQKRKESQVWSVLDWQIPALIAKPMRTLTFCFFNNFYIHYAIVFYLL